jgi:hypothetical protein
MRRTRNTVFFFGTILLCALVLAACSQPDSTAAVRAFLEALAAKKLDQVPNLVCSAWEGQAAVEFDAFGAVTATLQGLDCKQVGKDGDDALIACQGKIVLNYNGENRDMPLDKRTYRARMDGGKWKMCGYQ